MTQYIQNYGKGVKNNFINLSNILNQIAIKHNHKLFENGEIKEDSKTKEAMPSEMKEGSEHTKYRNWQRHTNHTITKRI